MIARCLLPLILLYILTAAILASGQLMPNEEPPKLKTLLQQHRFGGARNQKNKQIDIETDNDSSPASMRLKSSGKPLHNAEVVAKERVRSAKRWDFQCFPDANLTRCANSAGCNLFCNFNHPEDCGHPDSVCNVLPVGWPFCVTTVSCGDTGFVGGYAPHMYPPFSAVQASDLQPEPLAKN